MILEKRQRSPLFPYFYRYISYKIKKYGNNSDRRDIWTRSGTYSPDFKKTQKAAFSCAEKTAPLPIPDWHH
ncbi:hypothetical protein OB236_19620 [Paenibacillus sp. WQ 127069]|jgi:hypothetical protein|uniref:Uncharacterized protein n=1 Tax=Paenibacillus baimaensis TaxID=2982185 RepID=A0ABT2UI77_9BACL|nr:hypothetical protein [Paenibacillus sp. WQ 127069]MCU6794317.1 hypothetical protein [Paenibacillus sp. WQ 127069]